MPYDMDDNDEDFDPFWAEDEEDDPYVPQSREDRERDDLRLAGDDPDAEV